MSDVTADVPSTRTLPLEEQRDEFARRWLLAMPMAGCVAWFAVGLAGVFLRPPRAALALFVATGSILYLGMFFSRFTGENFMDKTRPKNVFDGLFFHTVAMAVLVYAIAIPFFQADLTSLPLSIGVLSGLMWLPLGWIIRHWVGVFHAVVRTVLVVTAWYLFPAARFVAVPLVIVAVYLVTIISLEGRWRRIHRA